jgi:hypothetical protein
MNPIITCNLEGGVGNQLFQIANAYALSRHFDTSFCLIDQQFVGAGTGSHPSKYYTSLYEKIQRFNTEKPLTTFREPTWTYTSVLDSVRPLLQPNTILQLIGYFQSDAYFLNYSSEIKELFTPQGGIQQWLKTNSDVFEKWPELFEDHDFCFVGVRRGDYITKAYCHNPCGLDYYTKALAALPQTTYYIASDDIAWCKTHFVGPQYVFFDIQDDLVQLLAGCLFKNYIIANSTFHWWMSFLSVFDEPRIVAPDKWIFGPTVQWHEYSTIYRKGMQIIERLIETYY